MYTVGHKQPPRYPPHHISPSLLPLYYVCVFMWGWITIIIGVESTDLRSTLALREQCTPFHRGKHSCAETGMENQADTKQRLLNWTTRRGGVRVVVVVVLGGWWLGQRSETMISDHITKDSHKTSSRKADLVNMHLVRFLCSLMLRFPSSSPSCLYSSGQTKLQRF